MFRSHRQAFLDHMEDGDIALFQGANHMVRNHDVDFPFRQQSGFWYLTGLPEADGALMLAKGVEGVAEETLFVLPRDPAKETWHGRRLGPEGAMEKLGFADARENDEFPEVALSAMQKAKRVWCRLGEQAELDAFVLESLSAIRKQTRLGLTPPSAVLDPGPVLDELRLFKSEGELNLMRRAAAVSAEAHMLAMAQCNPGFYEHQLEALLHFTFRNHGCNDAGWAYPSIVASGANACILHYTDNNQACADGDLVLIDAGGEFQHYAADITRCFPVNGTFSPAQRAVYQVVLDAQIAAVDAVRAGNPFHDIHDLASLKLCEGLVSLGVVKTSVEEAMETGSFRKWTIHNTSHWIGLDVHDCGAYRFDGVSRPLEPGMVLTVEPGLYFSPDDDSIPSELRGIGVRIEDDIHVTGGTPENLTVATPKAIADVEQACAAERLAPPTLESAGI
ncbi:MAG: aminopeptidase P N-terminal domain-containing protein [Planctomycetota bacterium]|nr:aminopeptidase P N-terminal domain-containing protein [Planctomycetota bacterium]MDA1113526.1 aminopeptidase P N-terminal domain-containing protein [Planctomycetota bacterium]